MTRITDGPKNINPISIDSSSQTSGEASKVDGGMSASAKELLGIIKVSLAPAPGRAWDVNAISKRVIDSWIQRNVPTRMWGETLRSQLREHLTEALRDDPTFQALLQKLVRENMP